MDARRSANRRYAAGTVTVLGAVLALSVLAWAFRPPVPDPETLCPTARPIRAHTLVIVDRTDRWDPAVGQTITELIEHAQRSTAQYEKFSVVSLDENMSTRPVFSVCNPGEPNFVSDLYKGRRYTKRDFEERFVGASDAVLAQLQRPSAAPQSPIVEYVHRWLGRDDFNASIPNRRLILVSDMRQNSPEHNMYVQGQTGLPELVQREFGESGAGVAYDIYFVHHGGDSRLSEQDVRNAWDAAFRRISATYAWKQL
ncbi:MAG: hypothetical protein JNJ73_14620 [Hyphomonadaceae bacterium]|nr:hypothetical protein [Hyphomonadaceae bacterium]